MTDPVWDPTDVKRSEHGTCPLAALGVGGRTLLQTIITEQSRLRYKRGGYRVREAWEGVTNNHCPGG